MSLFLGTLIVTVIYVATNLMYIYVMPLKEIAFAENDRLGVAASQHIFGDSGTLGIVLIGIPIYKLISRKQRVA